MSKPKRVNFRIIDQNHPAWELLSKAMLWHDELDAAKIALAWRFRFKADKDGRLVIGKCVKITEREKEFHDNDFVILLNAEVWNEFSDAQRLALLDHELSHAAAALENDTAEHKEDERGRKLWRVRKHDIEEFRGVIERHGCYKADLEEFARAILESKKSPLFERNG